MFKSKIMYGYISNCSAHSIKKIIKKLSTECELCSSVYCTDCVYYIECHSQSMCIEWSVYCIVCVLYIVSYRVGVL